MRQRTPASVATSPWRAVYGSGDGRWYVLAGPADTRPPSAVDGVGHLGSPTDLVRLLRDRWRHAKAPDPQRRIAEVLACNQTTVSRYLRGAQMYLSDDAWRNLVIEVCQGGGTRRTPVG